jgi:hypothetical protein
MSLPGALARRPGWNACLDHLRAGDELVVTRLSRMARSVRHLSGIAALLAERGIDLVVLKQGIDTATVAGRFTPGAPATDGNSNPNRYVPPAALASRTDPGSCTNPRHGPACSAPEAGPGFREDELAGGGQVWPCSTCRLLLWMRAT